MCQSCAGFDDEDDTDALAAAFVLRQARLAADQPQHALLNRKAVQAPKRIPAPRDQNHA